MGKNRASRKSSGINDNINDFLDRREVRNYGPRVIANEAQYSQGEMSRMLRAKMTADRMTGRTVEFGTRSMLEGMKSFMRGGGGFRTGGK